MPPNYQNGIIIGSGTPKMGEVISINISKTKGTFKKPVEQAYLEAGLGILGDAHSGTGKRQVSLLALEDIERIKGCPKVNPNPQTQLEISTSLTEKAKFLRGKAKNIKLTPGVFAENITTKGLDADSLKIGTLLRVGKDVLLKISQKGKECHKFCAIYHKIGDCIMPKKGMFAEVIKGGRIKVGDKIVLCPTA